MPQEQNNTHKQKAQKLAAAIRDAFLSIKRDHDYIYPLDATDGVIIDVTNFSFVALAEALMDGVKIFQCGTGEMGTLYWSKDADLDKLPELHPAPIDPEVDRIDFYIKTADGEYIPWKPTEAQKQMITALGLPTRGAGTDAGSPPALPK